MYVEPEGPLDRLLSYVVMAAARRPELLSFQPEAYQGEEDCAVYETMGSARMAVLVAEALMLMAKDVHGPEDQFKAPKVSPEQARIWVKENGSLRAAARAVGVHRNTLSRALRELEEYLV